MSAQILAEIRFFVSSVTIGVLESVIYDGVRILRRVIPHHKVMVALEDLLFWLVTLFLMFFCLYDMNDGVLRWFSVVGVLIGIRIYKKIFGEYLVEMVSAVLNKALDIVKKVLLWLISPLILLKKKLTKLIDLVKLDITGRISRYQDREKNYDSHNL